MMALAAVPAFELANLASEEATYDIHFVSEHGVPVSTSAGMNVETEAFARRPSTRSSSAAARSCNRRRPASSGSFSVQPLGPARRRHLQGPSSFGEAGLLDGDGSRRTDACTGATDPIPEVLGRHGPHLHQRRPDLDVGGDECRYRLGAALIEADLGPEVTKGIGRCSCSTIAGRWPVAVLDPARPRRQIGRRIQAA